MKYTVISVERCAVDASKLLVTVERQPTWWERWRGRQPERLQFRGDCTVWFTFPEFVRCSIYDEVMLSQVQRRWEYEQLKREQTP